MLVSRKKKRIQEKTPMPLSSLVPTNTNGRIAWLMAIVAVVATVLGVNRMIRCNRQDTEPTDKVVGSSDNKIVTFTLFGVIALIIAGALATAITSASDDMKQQVSGGAASVLLDSVAPVESVSASVADAASAVSASDVSSLGNLMAF